jgi:hypothetical protein
MPIAALDWPSNVMALSAPMTALARSATNPRKGASKPFRAERALFPIRSYCFVLWGYDVRANRR